MIVEFLKVKLGMTVVGPFVLYVAELFVGLESEDGKCDYLVRRV